MARTSVRAATGTRTRRAKGPVPDSVAFQPATPARWDDLARLFGPRGACAGCWCMWPRLTSREYNAGRGDGHRRRLRAIVAADQRPGILAYAGGEPVGWCAVAPRAEYTRLSTSRVMAPVDDREVWSSRACTSRAGGGDAGCRPGCSCLLYTSPSPRDS